MSGKVRAPSFFKNSGHTPPFFAGHRPSWLAAFETRQGKAYDLPPGPISAGISAAHEETVDPKEA